MYILHIYYNLVVVSVIWSVHQVIFEELCIRKREINRKRTGPTKMDKTKQSIARYTKWKMSELKRPKKKTSFTFTSWQQQRQRHQNHNMVIHLQTGVLKWKWNECRNARVRISNIHTHRASHILKVLKSKAQSVSSEKHMHRRNSIGIIVGFRLFFCRRFYWSLYS